MSRYENMFERLAATREGALVPFCVLGDPDERQTLDVVDALVAGGADALELGFPFSDPVADGPVIQAAAVRALAAGVTPERCMRIVKQIRASFVDLPIGVLVYSNLVERAGPADFFRRLAASGADSVLIADLPTAEVTPYAARARAAGLGLVMIAPPNIGDVALRIVAETSAGFTYVLGRPGVTGVEISLQRPEPALMTRLRQLGAPPPLVGFGISEPEHVLAALGAGARGVVVGSAIVKIVNQYRMDGARRREELIQFVARLKEECTRGS
jgi:tryptophan synthase alpha chain